MGESNCVCLRLRVSGCGCVRACAGRQFQGSLTACLLIPDVRYVYTYTDAYCTDIASPQDPGF